MNNKKQQNIQSEKTLTEIFKYNAGGEASEYHIIIHSTKPEDTYEEQLNAVLNTYDYLLTQELKGAVAILKRYFLSDAANQADTLLALTTEGSDCALSIVEQPPLDGTKIALWVYLLTDVQTQVLHNGLFEVKHSAYRHFWGGSAFNRAANSEYQTRLLLNDYDRKNTLYFQHRHRRPACRPESTGTNGYLRCSRNATGTDSFPLCSYPSEPNL